MFQKLLGELRLSWLAKWELVANTYTAARDNTDQFPGDRDIIKI